MFSELENWRKARGKPVMMTEYGADTVAGLHMEPAMVFTEEYQVRVDSLVEIHRDTVL